MPEQRIKDRETQLSAATATITPLTATNFELTRGLADADGRNRKLKRSASRDESTLRDQLAVAQNKRR